MSNSVRPHRWQPTRLPWPWDSPGKNTGVGCHFLFQCMKVKSESEVAQSCPILRDPMACSLPGSSIHEIFQARILEWDAIALCSIFFFTTLILLVHKHDTFLHPFVSSLISFISILYFSVYRSFASLVNLFLSILFFYCNGEWDCFLNLFINFHYYYIGK